METVLAVLKFLGIFLTGALGILGTITKTHADVGPDGIKKLNRWGHWVLALTVTGLAIAICSQLAEELLDRHGAIEARALATENRRLQLAERTRFDTIEASCVFELSLTDPRAKSLAEGLRLIALHPEMAKASGLKAREGYLHAPLDSLVAAPGDSVPGLRELLPLISQIPKSLQGWTISRAILSHELSSLRGQHTELMASDPFPQRGWTLQYSTTTGRVFLGSPVLKYSAQNITRTGRVIGASDLAGMQMRLWMLFSELPEAARPLLPLLQPAWIELRFDEFAITLDSFKTQIIADASATSLNCDAALPDADAIANGTNRKVKPQ